MADVKTDVNEVSQRILQQQLDSAAASINQAFQSLVKNQPHPQINDDAFQYWFLPYFSGNQQALQLQNRNVISEWVGVAGSAMTEVDVVDKQGKVMFSVPALFDTNMLEIASRAPGRSFADLYYEYELRKGGMPKAANNYLNHALNSKADELVKGDDVQSSVAQRWSSIMQHYKIAPATDGIRQSVAQAPVDDVDYE